MSERIIQGSGPRSEPPTVGGCAQWRSGRNAPAPRHNGGPELDASDSDGGTPHSGSGADEGPLRQNGLESRRERHAKARTLELQPLQRSSFL